LAKRLEHGVFVEIEEALMIGLELLAKDAVGDLYL
jgi:hypothetical protein